MLIERIRSQAADARVLHDAGRNPGAFLHILLGFEELGKLLEYIQLAAAAEGSAAKEIEGVSHHKEQSNVSHTKKAALSSEYMQRGLKLAGWALRATGIPDDALGGYLDHLSAIGKDFMGLRDTLMFVDYVNGTWTRGRSLDQSFLDGDIGALELVAALVEAGLQGQPTFAGTVETFTDLEREMRQKLPDLIRNVLARYAELVKSKQK